MMTDRTTAGLAHPFENNRIVFWYDTARDMHGEYGAVDLPAVEKVEITNNEFGLKFRMLRQEAYLTNNADVDDYLDELKKTLLEQIHAGMKVIV
jgi:hypothetical protein